MLNLSFGDRAPVIVGATSTGVFYSADAQAGRPALFACLGGLGPDPELVRDLVRQGEGLKARGVDLLMLAPQSAAFADAISSVEGAEHRVIYTADSSGLERFTLAGRPALLAIDRSGRIAHLAALLPGADLLHLADALAPRFQTDAPRRCSTSAPALILPNILSPETCRALIDHFEASPHGPGLMASMARDGGAEAKLDESKKRRRDIELTADAPLHAEVVAALASRISPEIKRAFQADIVFADRILIARYDDDGGFFKRHRDNVAPHVAFREFAVSLNLNTDDYEGGELLFPEFDDHRYAPPAGGAVVFSASVLHEAAEVTRGSRYVLLTFLCTAAAEARMSRAA